MKVLLIQDVFKLGRAGDVKKVADGYGRNYLIPQELAVLATPGALKQAEHIRDRADAKRAILNQEMSGIADMLTDLTLEFTAKAGETDKLYGSITSQMIVDEIQEKLGAELNRRQVDHEPIRMLGEHSVRIRLTMDLIPEIKVNVLREGEIPGEAVEEPTEEEASDAIEETPAAEEATVLEEPETEEAEVSAEESTEESAPVDEVEEAADSETPAEIVDEAPAETEAETEE